MTVSRTAFYYKLKAILSLCALGVGLMGCVVIPPPVESHFNRGVDLYDKGKYSEAIEEYKLALRANPKDDFSRYNLAVAYQDQGKLQKAANLYMEILEHAEDTNSRINLAVIYYEQSKADLAFGQLQKAAAGNPDSPNPQSVMGEFLERENRLMEAEKQYLKAIEIEEKHAVTHFRLGRLYFNQGKLKKGELHMKKAIELEPDEPSYPEALGKNYESQERVFDAINMLERASVLQPDRADILVRLGDLYKQKEYFQKAVLRYWLALALNDENPHVHKTLKEMFEILLMKEKEKIEQYNNQNLSVSPQIIK